MSNVTNGQINSTRSVSVPRAIPANLYNPSSLQPNQSNINQPNRDQFNANQSNVNQSNANQSNVNQFNTNQPNVNQFNTNQPNVNQFNANQPNVNQFNANSTNQSAYSNIYNPNDALNNRPMPSLTRSNSTTPPSTSSLTTPPSTSSSTPSSTIFRRNESTNQLRPEDMNLRPIESSLTNSSNQMNSNQMTSNQMTSNQMNSNQMTSNQMNSSSRVLPTTSTTGEFNTIPTGATRLNRNNSLVTPTINQNPPLSPSVTSQRDPYSNFSNPNINVTQVTPNIATTNQSYNPSSSITSPVNLQSTNQQISPTNQRTPFTNRRTPFTNQRTLTPNPQFTSTNQRSPSNNLSNLTANQRTSSTNQISSPINSQTSSTNQQRVNSPLGNQQGVNSQNMNENRDFSSVLPKNRDESGSTSKTNLPPLIGPNVSPRRIAPKTIPVKSVQPVNRGQLTSYSNNNRRTADNKNFDVSSGNNLTSLSQASSSTDVSKNSNNSMTPIKVKHSRKAVSRTGDPRGNALRKLNNLVLEGNGTKRQSRNNGQNSTRSRTIGNNSSSANGQRHVEDDESNQNMNNDSLSKEDLNLILRATEPETILSLLLALDRNVINPDRVLIQAIELVQRADGLIPIALALRFGANPNTYVQVVNSNGQPSGEKIHIMIFTYYQLKNRSINSILNAIIVMLYIKGSQYVAPAVSDNGGGIRYNEDRILARSRSVQDVLNNDQSEEYKTIFTRLDPSLQNVDPDFLLTLATLLDDIELVARAESRIHSRFNSNNYEPNFSRKDTEFNSDVHYSVNKYSSDHYYDTIHWKNVRLKEVLMAHSYQVLATMLTGQKGIDFPLTNDSLNRSRIIASQINSSFMNRDHYTLHLSLLYLNLIAFQSFLQVGYRPDYITINQLLIDYRLYLAMGDRVAAVTVQDMLQRAISTGADIDRYQFAMLQQMDSNAARIIANLYQVPIWSKQCRTASPININLNKINNEWLMDHSLKETQKEYGVHTANVKDTLHQLAFELGLPSDLNRDSLCRHLSQLAQQDIDTLVKMAKDRQVVRVSTSVARPDEYNRENLSRFLCSNRAVEYLQGRDPYEYNDDDLVFYRDNSDSVWCFVSDSFDSLLEDGLNPITGQPLPRKILREMIHKKNLAADLGLKRDSASPPLTYRQALNQLQVSDNIDDSYNNRLSDAFYRTANRYGVDSTGVQSLSKDDMIRILEGIPLTREVDLTILNTAHARITFIHALYERMINAPKQTPIIFDLIKSRLVPIQ